MRQDNEKMPMTNATALTHSLHYYELNGSLDNTGRGHKTMSCVGHARNFALVCTYSKTYGSLQHCLNENDHQQRFILLLTNLVYILYILSILRKQHCT